jgi:phosphate transport system substrate-binding protein
MEDGCEAFEAIAALEGDRKTEVCHRMRTDGPFVEAGENDNLIVQRLQQDSDTLGIFGYSFLYENQDTLKGVAVNGVQATPETIGDDSYPVSRPLFFYVKNPHRNVIPGLGDFVEEYVSEGSIGPDGYLRERGLISLSDEDRRAVQDAIADGAAFERYGS